MDKSRHSRRGLLRAGLASLGGLVLGGCDQISDNSVVQRLFEASEALTYKAQSALLGSGALAREYTEADISPSFKANGSTDPQDEAYLKLVADGFKDWQLTVDGLVDRPQSFSSRPSGPCRLGRRSRATIAWKAGAASANGPACRSATCSTSPA